MQTFLLPLARVLMSSLFIWDGVLQLRNPGGTARYFASVDVPVPNVAVWVSVALFVGQDNEIRRASVNRIYPGRAVNRIEPISFSAPAAPRSGSRAMSGAGPPAQAANTPRGASSARSPC